MRGRDDEAAVQADAYIDTLIAAHGLRLPAPTDAEAPLPPGVRRAIQLLEGGLPRFHPSFRFEEALSGQLRSAVSTPLGLSPPDAPGAIAEVIPFPPRRVMSRPAGVGAGPVGMVMDRRLLVGGAIASTVSLAGAAMLVRAARQRGGRSRSRPEWLS